MFPIPTPPVEPDSAVLWIERPPWSLQITWIVLAIVILAVDYFSGPLFQFPFLFIIPILLVAWNGSKRSSLLMTLVLCGFRFSFNFIWVDGNTLPVAVLNLFIRIGILFLLAFLANRVARQTRSLQKRVVELEGVLPICSHCKNIREDDGSWTKMETYIGYRSEAKFSHAVCPDCLQTHYGDLLMRPPASNAE